MTDLALWLTAQFDEDERIACAASPGPWRVDSTVHTESINAGDGTTIIAGARWGDEASVFESDEDAAHIVEHDPARVLREVGSKRRQAAWCVEVIGDRDLSRYDEVGSLKDDKDALAVTLAVETLRLLALPYADRPGYQEAWRP